MVPMRKVYRVLPWKPRAAPGAPGHPLHVPSSNGTDRLGNPEDYSVLYVSSSPAGAVAEAFGHVDVWVPAMFRTRDGMIRALAEFTVRDSSILDLDDPHELVERSLRPSLVVTRDRETTQQWAKAVFHENRWAGVEWWSYYDPRWSSIGLWSMKPLKVSGTPAPLTLDHPAITEAAEILARRIEVA